MKKALLNLSMTSLVVVMFAAIAFTQTTQKSKVKKTNPTIELIQFHSEHRCMTCNLIEKLTREVVKSYPEITFRLINVDEEKNGKIAEEFEASGTAVFLYNPVTKAKKDLTEFAFMNAKTKPEVYKNGLKKEIKNFKK